MARHKNTAIFAYSSLPNGLSDPVQKPALLPDRRCKPRALEPDPDLRVDWFRVLVQLQAEGYSLHGVAFFIGIPKSTLIAYKQGMQPSYNVGARIIRCWAEVTGNDPATVPMISPYSFKA